MTNTASTWNATLIAPAPAAPTAQLLRLVSNDEPFDLVPVGITLHCFTEPLRAEMAISLARLHQATTILTKQIKQVLSGDNRLRAIRSLVTDAHRVATSDGLTVEELCGPHWPTLRAIADQRAAAAEEGAVSFGEPAILRLAATRAVAPTCPWWGTRGWTELVDRWASDTGHGRRSITPLLVTPESARVDVVAAILTS